MRLVARGLGVIVLLLVATAGLLVVSSRLSVDGEYQHTQRTEKLPVWSPGTDAWLVRIPARGMAFRARITKLDETERPAVILLHGFPETSVMWERVMAAADARGFRVVAFDQRGYSPGARPEATEAYRVGELVADVFAVADAVGFERFHLVGHDWGSIVGWAAAAEDPARVLSYASLSIPHPGAIGLANAAQGTPGYIRLFRAEGVPEILLTAGDLYMMRRLMYADMPADHLEEYLSVFSEPGALRAALNWYRAPGAFGSAVEPAPKVVQPVLYVFGNRDMPVFVRPAVRALQPRFVTGPFEEVELDAGHWLIEEEPGKVVQALMQHLEARQRARTE